MKKEGIVIILSAFCLCIYSGCATLMDLIQTPKVTFEDLRLREMSLFGGTLVFNLRVDNPNPIGGKLNTVDYDLKLGGQNFVNGVLDKGVTLKPGGSEVVEIPVTINYLDFFQTVQDFLKKDKIPYDLSGSFKIEMFSIPYRVKGELDVPSLPSVSLSHVKVKDLTMKGVSLSVDMAMKNKNNFSINLNGLDYNIKMGGYDFFSGKVNQKTTVNSGDTTTISIPLDIEFQSFGQAAQALFNKSSSHYEVTGNMEFDVPGKGSKKFPFSQMGKVSFQR